MTYLITGFPRSMTAWLANFLTYGPSHCFHEPIVYHRVREFPELFKSVQTAHVGVSDSGSVFYVHQFMDLFPNAKIVLVKRDQEEVVSSMARLGFDFRVIIDKFRQAFAEIEKRYEVLIVPFGALPAAEIWEYCIPGVPVNKMRLQMLQDFKITIRNDILFSNVQKGITKMAAGEEAF